VTTSVDGGQSTPARRGARWSWAAVGLVLAAGMILRLMDLTDEPLDFHPTAQLLRALTAREMYQSSTAESGSSPVVTPYEVLEPPILERLTALTYRIVGGETPWVARIWNAIFWLMAAVFLFRMASKATSIGGGLVSLAYFLIIPLGVQVSRAFMPDSLMILMIVLSGYFLVRWADDGRWESAVLAGVASGAAILVKGRIAPMVLLTVLAVAFGSGRWRRLRREPQMWAVGLLTVSIPAVYYAGMTLGSTTGWVQGFSLDVLWMILSPSHYSRWLAFLDQVVYVGVMLLGLYGATLLAASTRRLSLGWWGGFLATGLLLPYHAVTHSYYSLPLVPVISLGLAPVGQILLDRLRGLAPAWRAVAIGAALLMVFYPAWRSRSVIVGQDFRGEPAGWQALANKLPTDGAMIAITQDYGYRLAYYGGRHVTLWPSAADLSYADLRGQGGDGAFSDVFEERTRGFRYFLVTNMGELDSQPELKDHLYAHFPQISTAEEFLLFDLSPTTGMSPGRDAVSLGSSTRVAS